MTQKSRKITGKGKLTRKAKYAFKVKYVLEIREQLYLEPLDSQISKIKIHACF